MYNISKKIKRFIIIWTLIQIFALLVNYAGLNWKITSDSKSKGTHGLEIDETFFNFYVFTDCDGIGHDNDYSFNQNKSQLWPFVTFFDGRQFQANYNTYAIITDFNGIFYKYDFTEFIIYVLLPFVFLLIKQLW